mgnify:FL=1|jgi:hypothetical protein
MVEMMEHSGVLSDYKGRYLHRNGAVVGSPAEFSVGRMPAGKLVRAHQTQGANSQWGLRWIPGGAHKNTFADALPDYW